MHKPHEFGAFLGYLLENYTEFSVKLMWELVHTYIYISNLCGELLTLNRLA